MSEGENHHHGKNEIIIVKRHKGDHDGAHGGAWKIAYADFMTAMMAFFLVMWLVNAANEETKASVASYFNPIQLTDDTPSSKGIKEPAKDAQGENDQQKSTTEGENAANADAAQSGEDMTSSAGEQTRYSEADFFENPYAVLAEIAQEVGQQANVSVKGEGGASDSGPSTGASGGVAYRDPFDPDFWSKQVEVKEEGTGRTQVADSSLPEVAKPPQSMDEIPTVTSTDATSAPNQQLASVDTTGQVSDAPVDIVPLPKPENLTSDKNQTETKTEDQVAAPTAQDVASAEELREEIASKIAGVGGKLAEGIIVSPTEGGTLVTISDQADGAMFGVGSAVPQRDLVLAMEKIGEVLKARQGSVIIRGHTDTRPYNSAGRDNWTLSMERAHAAYFMLVRGGLEEGRVKQLSGFADRRLQTPEDPLNGTNRRIEILVEDS
jgi:chemotaxis protein MotB